MSTTIYNSSFKQQNKNNNNNNKKQKLPLQGNKKFNQTQKKIQSLEELIAQAEQLICKLKHELNSLSKEDTIWEEKVYLEKQETLTRELQAAGERLSNLLLEKEKQDGTLKIPMNTQQPPDANTKVRQFGEESQVKHGELKDNVETYLNNIPKIKELQDGTLKIPENPQKEELIIPEGSTLEIPKDSQKEFKENDSDSDSDSGHSSASTSSVDTVIETVYVHNMYQPNIVSVHDLPTWNQTMDTYQADENNLEALTQVISNSVGKEWFAPIFGNSTALFISTLTTSMLSIGTAINTMYQTISKTNRMLQIATLVSSLITFVLTVGNLFMQKGISFNSDKIITQVNDVVKGFSSETTANSINWFYPAITTIISIVIAGLTLFNVCDVKSIIQQGMLIRSTQHITTAAKDVSKFLLEDLLHIDITGDQLAHNELHEWAKRTSELATLPYLDYLRDNVLFKELEEAIGKTLPIITYRYQSRTLSATSRAAYTLILQNMHTLTEKLSAIKVIKNASKRQETLGVLLAGEAAVGKSTLSNYIARKLGERMGYNTGLYNLAVPRKDGFYGPYGGQDFGIIDEFMALRSNDPNLPCLNQILSGDHFNFEAAHLEGKNQPSALKCVFLTTNNLSPDVVKVLDTDAAKALWDRILRFEVIDVRGQGRQGENKHRLKDFTHLRFRMVMNTRELVATNLLFDHLTIDEVLGVIMYQIAKRELNFLRQEHITDAPVVDQAERVRREDWLESVCNANASHCGQNFNVIRIQGPLKTGKTQIGRRIIQNIYNAYPGWKRFEVKNFEEPPLTRGLYLIDDILVPSKENYEQFLKWINQGDMCNLYILVTNFVIKRERHIANRIKRLISGNDSFYWNVNTYGASSGIARRIGLHGTVQTETKASALVGENAITIDVDETGNYLYNGAVVTQQELIDYTYRYFGAIVIDKNEVTIVHDIYNGFNEDFDAVVTCDNVQSLSNTFRSRTAITASCFKKTNGTEIKFTTALFNTMVSSFEDAATLMPGRINNDIDLVNNAMKIATILNDIKAGIKCKLIIKDTRREIILHDKKLYVGNPIAEQFEVTHNRANMEIIFVWQNQRHSMTYKEYAEFKNAGRMPQILNNLPSPLIGAIHQYVASEIGETEPMLNYHMWLSTIIKKKQEFSNKTLIDFIKDNKVLSVVIGLVSLGLVTGVITILAKLFKSDDEEEDIKIESNASGVSSDEEYKEFNNIKNETETFKRNLLHNPEAANLARQSAIDRGYKDAWNRWEHDFRSNALIDYTREFKKAVGEANIERMEYLLKTKGDEIRKGLLHANANNLTVAEEEHQAPSEVEVLAEKLRKNYVLVSGRGKVYGLGLCNRLLITVSHIFVDQNSPVTIQSDGKTYEGRVLRLSRKRDLAIVCVLDNKFPQFKDIRNMLLSETEFPSVEDSYFIRPTSKPLLVSTKLTFISNVASPKIDDNNPLYRLEAQHWQYDTIGMMDPYKIFKRGDCGLPILTLYKDQPKILGIHNALSIAGYAWFSSICEEDLFNIQANSTCDSIIHQVSKKHMVVDPYTKELLQGAIHDSVYQGCSKLRVFGYMPNLRFYSNPAFKKKYVSIGEKYAECPKIPAALNMDNVKDASELYKDRKGNILPLFSQAVKYAEKLPTLGTYDLRIDDYVTQIIKTMYDVDYGTTRILKLHEVVNGVGHLKGLEMETSVGPKIKKQFGIQTKRPLKTPDILFTNLNESKLNSKPYYRINDTTKAGKTLMDDYYLYHGSIAQGYAPLIISKDNAKVELLPKEKVAVGKVRLFNELDLSINMVLKSYFGDFLNKVIAKHEMGMYCIGTNPYLDATTHMLQFDAIEGEFLNADFKALDKSTPSVLIKDFVECVLRNETYEIRTAMAEMLTNRLHTLDGNIYFIDCGNCSGSYVTTLMNCHTVLKVSLYTFCRKWLEDFKVFPTYGEIKKNFVIKILGDDAIRKISNVLTVTDKDLVEDAAKYGLTQTPTKTEGLVSFCSRTYVQVEPMIYFPKLSEKSILAMLFWYNQLTREQIQSNLVTALLEASLHDEEFYNTCKNIAIDVCAEYSVPFDITPYKYARELFIDYIRGHRISPVSKAQEDLTIQSKIQIEANSTLNFQKFKNMADMWINEYLQKRGMQPAVYEYSAEGPDNNLEWKCTGYISVDNDVYRGTGEGKTKAISKRNACESLRKSLPTEEPRLKINGEIIKDHSHKLYQQLRELQIPFGSVITYGEIEPTRVTANADQPMELTAPNQPAPIMQISLVPSCTIPQPTGIVPAMTATMNYGEIEPTKVTANSCDEPLIEVECDHARDVHTEDCFKTVKYHFRSDKLFKKWLKSEWKSMTSITGEAVKILRDQRCIFTVRYNINNYIKTMLSQIEPTSVTSNADQPMEPATMNQSAHAMQVSSLPSQTNPQPTGTIPAMTSAGEDIMANLQYAEHQVLQPVGAPNMLAVGAITFDIKHLIYEQFLDADIELEITDDLPSGSVILQIPYGVNTPWVNSYIKNYARLHERYAGAIQYRFTVIGNPLFSGSIGIAWLNRANPTSTILVSEAQKFAYTAKGVTMPWNQIHTLHDGRQDLFYRNTDEVVDANRPHLCVFLLLSLQNPLREGVKTRLRVASKLCNAADPNPFIFSLPVPYRELPVNTTNSLQPSAFDDLFINATNTKINIYSDGTLATPQKYTQTYYPEYNEKAFAMSSSRRCVQNQDELSTNTSAFYANGDAAGQEWSNYLQEWDMFSDLLSILNFPQQGKAVVSIVSQTTMDALSFSTLLLASPWGGMGGGITTKFTQANWNRGKTSTGWSTSDLNRPQAPVKIHAVVYNNQSYVLRDQPFNGNNEYLMMGQYIKVITDCGTTIFYVISLASPQVAPSRTTSQMYGMCGLSNIDTPTTSYTIPSYPYLNIDEQLGFTSPIDSLPLGYQALRITDIPPSAILISGYPGATATDNATISRWFQRRSADLPLTQCLQFRLTDAVSVRTIATVRYLQEYNVFVINTATNNAYRALPILTQNIIVQAVIVTDRTNDFQVTDTFLWFDRGNNSFTKSPNFQTIAAGFENNKPVFDSAIPCTSVQSNAMLATAIGGGIMSGIGGAIEGHTNRKHQEKMQSNQFGHEEGMQGNMFNFQKEMQGNSFEFQKMMQQGNFGQEQLMQERGYQNDLGLLQSSHQEQRITNQMQSQNRMTEKGLSSKVNFLTNPGSSQA